MTGPISGPPARPDAPAGAVLPGRRWLPAGLVALVMAATVLGGFVVAGALPVPDVRPLALGGVVTLRPLPGWEVARREDVALPSPSGGVIRGSFTQLTRGSGALDVLTLPGFGGASDELAGRYADEVLSFQLERLSVSDALDPVTLRSGLEGVRFGYIGTEPESGGAIEGSVTAAVAATGNAVVFDGWASEGQLELIEDELTAMIHTAEVS
jgi:hypothetical protein